MKVEYVNDYNFYLYLNKDYLIGLDLDNKESIENYFKAMFLKLKKNHHMDIYGYYNIKVYANKNYGLIVDVFKLGNDYFKMPNNKVDMKIAIDKDNVFIYELDDFFFTKKYEENIKNVYYKNQKYYIELNKNVDETFYLYLMEHSNIIFDDDAYEIITTSFKL
ncbi:MAG TPA: hypothetical protein GXZ95_01505 [Mollicutes bacterium]|nr:hypothetical protein [Mollicutes bacterium]